MKPNYFLCSIAAILLAACSHGPDLVTDCVASGTMTPICKFQNPEDLEALPDGKTLLVSQMGKDIKIHTPGSLVFFNTETDVITPAFPLPVATTAAAANAEKWGAANCPGIPDARFSPHGISLKQRTDTRWQIAVVNHGGGERIDLFELLDYQTGGNPRIEWRGCVVPAAEVFPNDVAVLKDGGIVASHMYDNTTTELFGFSINVWKAMLGFNTGHVWEWHQSSGFHILEGSRGPFINGVEVSADNTTVYANVYFGGEILRLDRASGKRTGAATVGKADNLAWNSKGELLAVAHPGSTLETIRCFEHPGSTCTLPYTVWRINPTTMSNEMLFTHRGAPMGAATVARELGGALYLGSYSGDRMVKMPYPK